MFGEVFNNEIKLKEDECCIVFDFGCYFPYEDADHLFFDFDHTFSNWIIKGLKCCM